MLRPHDVPPSPQDPDRLHDGPMAADVVAREVVVHGRVQGVAFRATCHQQAHRLGLAGWVTNEPDGSVRAWLEGPREAVDAMEAWCRHGPTGSRVDRALVVDRGPEGLRGFTVR